MKYRKSFKKSFFIKNKIFFSKISSEFVKIGIVVIVVLGLTWGITKATENELESATNNFSVIGTVSSISDETISLINARGTDTQEEELYNLNIKYLDKVETKNYQPLIISDIKPGDTIIAQGVTNNTTFFIKRIVSFPAELVPQQTDVAAASDDMIATSTRDNLLDKESENSNVSNDDSSNTDSNSSTQLEESADTQEGDTVTTQESSTTTINNIIPTSTSETSSTTQETSPVINTVTEIIEDGLDKVSSALDIFVDAVSPAQEEIPIIE